MLNLAKLSEKFEERFPLELAESWDNVGLLVGDKDKKINKVLVCLDLTYQAIKKAKEENIDLIISHHPLIFSPSKKILKDDLLGGKILELIENKIAVYAAHTNLDSGKGGLNDYVLSKMNLKGEIYDYDLIPLRKVVLDEEWELSDLAKYIKNELGLKNIRMVRSKQNKKIKKLGLTTGGGDSFIPQVLSNVDLFITGDLRHHIALDSSEQDLHLIDLEHYGSEKFVVDLLENILKDIDTDLEVIKYNSSDVFEYL